MNIYAVIVAAGSGERFGDGGLKPLTPLAGMPMVAWAVKRIGDRRNITGIALVVPPGHEDEMRAGMDGHGGGDVDIWVEGGETRQDSVCNGIDALPPEATHVIVHDAARPCLTDTLLQHMLDALQTHGAVVPAVPATDTLVREVDGRLERVVDRTHVVGVQTPQAFDLELLRRAHANAQAKGLMLSDDGSLVLALDEEVVMVRGERTNIKVTYPEDIMIAEVILREQVEG